MVPFVNANQNRSNSSVTMEGDWSHRAMEWSHTASRHLRQDRLEESIHAYHQALEIYQHAMASHASSDATSTVISLCNAGSCWRNLGAIHRKRKAFNKAIESWKQAEELYRHGREQILAQQHFYDKTDYRIEEQIVSLDAYLVETLQTRATLHSRPKDAIECHEEAVELLMESSQNNNAAGEDNTSWYVRLTETLGTVVFGPMETSKQIEHLIVSLQALGTLYTTTGAYQEGLEAFEQALHYVRTNAETIMGHIPPDLSEIFQTVAGLYIEKEDWERAGQAIQDALELSPKPPPDDLLEAMDKMGQIYEENDDYGKAMTFYEQVLLTRNQYLGDMHVHVAKSLINVARVMELQGNDEGSLDIYRAAQAIYTRQVTLAEFRVAAEDVQSLLRLVPNVMEQGRYEEAVAYLNKCLESNNDDLDKTQIYFDLGQAYIGMGDYVSATVCLVECAKQDGAVSDDQIDQLLDHVEFLKQEQQAAFYRSHISSDSEDNDEQEQEELRSEEDIRSNTSETERSPVPSSGRPTSEEDSSTFQQYTSPSEEEVEENDDEIYKGGHFKAHQSPRKPRRDQLNGTPLTADFSRTASKSEQASIDEHVSCVGDDNYDYGNGDCELSDSPRQSQPINIVTPGTPSADSARSSYSSRVPSPVHSIAPVETPNIFRRQSLSITSPSDEDNDLIASKAQAIVDSEWQGEIELNQSADTRALLEPSDAEEEGYCPAKHQSKSRSRSKSVTSPRRTKATSPRRKKETKILDASKEKKSRFRRKKRQGFESLGEDKVSRSPSPPAATPLERDNEYHLDESSLIDAPVRIIEVEPGWDDISEISFNPHGRSTTWKRNNEWWWGVTAEGFGRWFPSSIVSQAVEAADGFLSAKAIHSRVKSAPLHVSEDESTDERGSQPTEEQASHLGVTSKKHVAYVNSSTDASKDYTEPIDLGSGNLGAMVVASSPGRRRKRQDVLSDIRECSQQIAEQRMKLDENDPALGETLFRLALLHGQNQNIGAAVESATSALRIQKLNSNFVVAARTLHFLAGLQLQERQYKSALNYYSEALRLETNLYGKYSEECAKTLNAIGTVRSLQNEFKMAMDSHKEALNVLKECHGEDVQGNPLVSQTLCQIGAVYYRERNALSSIKSKNGDYTTFIEAGMLEIIGRAHEERGSYKMAIAFFEEKLQFLENSPESELTQDELATTLNSLGMLSSRAGLFMEAVDYYERALALQMEIESDIVYMSTAKVLTATVQFQLGFWHKALQLLNEALPILEQELGDKHETVAATHYHIGVTQVALCDYDAAMTSFADAYSVQESLLGAAHPASLRTRREMGNLYAIYKSELEYSFEIFTEVLAAQQRIHGAKHPNIAETLHSIGVAYAQKGEDSTALKTLEECYYMRLEFLGVDHPLQATTLHEIAKIHIKKGRARKATSICETVIEIRKESLSEWHIDYARALATKGSSLSMRGEFEEATSCLDEAIKIAKQSVFATHPAIGEIQLEMGLLFLRKCQFNEAKKAVQVAADVFRKANFDEDHPGLLKVADLQDRIERDEQLYV